MPRKGPAPRRHMVADPVHHSVLVTQLVNKVMLRGKRSLAERIVYDAMEIIGTKTGDDSLTVVKRAVDNVKPPLEVKSRRVGGATYQVPMEVRAAAGQHAGDPLDRRLLPGPPREDDGRVPGRRADGRFQRPRRGDEAPRRHAEDGRVEQGLRPLPLVAISGRSSSSAIVPSMRPWRNAEAVIGSYRHGRSAVTHVGMQSTAVAGSGLTKNGIE